MQLDRNEYQEPVYEIGDADVVKQMPTLPAMALFDEKVVAFFNELSMRLMSISRDYPDVASFGFWCRKAALNKEKKRYDDHESRLGLGLVFHSTPSNVPVNFAYSFAAGLLSGNANIVRLPAKDFPQVAIICNTINELLKKKYSALAPYICMLRYTSATGLNDCFSSICDSRVVWGGDETVARMRKSPLKPRAREITFADRFSFAVIHADAYLSMENKNTIAYDFYNDTYLTDQNACTSPHLIVWIGDKKFEAKDLFWKNLYNVVKKEYSLVPIQVVGKLEAFYKLASKKEVSILESQDQFIVRVQLSKLDEDIMDYRYNSGFFLEYDALLLKEILPLCTERCQTIAYYGIEKTQWVQFMVRNRPHGIDRIVPIGKSMDFSFSWDGHELIRELSRKIDII